jgi:hypothetical protein
MKTLLDFHNNFFVALITMTLMMFASTLLAAAILVLIVRVLEAVGNAIRWIVRRIRRSGDRRDRPSSRQSF